jgi:hypothetical protein
LNLTAAQRQRYSDERLSLQELKSPPSLPIGTKLLSEKNTSQSIPLREGLFATERGSEAIRVANLPAADPLTSGRALASHLLALRVTDLIRNAWLR